MAKIISLNQTDLELIKLCLDNNRQAQKAMYDKYAPKMLSVCRRYIKDLQYAEDVMVIAFFKIFKRLNQFENKGSFEGWIKRIMVNEAISYLRSQKDYYINEVTDTDNSEEAVAEMNLDMEQWQNLIDELPKGCQMVFNLYVFEEYKHQEIAEQLQISISTSKTQLAHARKILQQKIMHLENFKYEQAIQ